jgi:hypothetical protein
VNDAHLPVPIEPAPPSKAARWGLIRDLAVFQVKLLVDGLKDLVLGPLSLLAGILDLVRGTDPAQGKFRGVLQAGAAFDRWVGLFDAVERSELGAAEQDSLDVQLRRIEALLVEQHERGGVTADAKQALDKALDLLEARLGGPPPSPPPP